MMKDQFARAAVAVIVAILLLLALRLAPRALPAGGEAMALAAYANADALAEIAFMSDSRDQ